MCPAFSIATGAPDSQRAGPTSLTHVPPALPALAVARAAVASRAAMGQVPIGRARPDVEPDDDRLTDAPHDQHWGIHRFLLLGSLARRHPTLLKTWFLFLVHTLTHLPPARWPVDRNLSSSMVVTSARPSLLWSSTASNARPPVPSAGLSSLRGGGMGAVAWLI